MSGPGEERPNVLVNRGSSDEEPVESDGTGQEWRAPVLEVVDNFSAAVGHAPDGGDGAVVVIPVASSGSLFQLYVTLGPFRVPGTVGGDRENRVLGLGRESGSRGRYSWRRQARELMEQQDESDMPA
ncbi:hypothetical protein Taro_027050 [Colocasia esculenta]|uniref:Uncharacterized protein n=1 Tax=Colocasia esculenta TaxID=4460 RepID=A0A843VQH2_COLES|nr:hypothetical protein [Colocasia esculenta]